MSEKIQVPEVDRWHLQTWLRIQASDKPKVYQRVFEATEFNSLSYWLEIFFSAGIATFGLVESSPAVIIGAMLISPLMGPIMATGLALAVGDLYLGIKAVLNLFASVTVSVVFSGFLVWLLPFHSATAEIVARTKPNLLDLGIALLSGLAGSVVVCRGGGNGVTALPGVAIAVALMPPLCTMGFGLGSGRNLEIMGGAGLLFLTNLVAIVASAFLVFLLVGMSTEEVQEAMLASRGDEPLERILSRGPFARMSAIRGQLRWRVFMLLILLGSIAVPLGRALLQRLARPAPVIPKEKTVGEMRQELLDRARPAIQEIWPSSDAPIQDFDVVLSTAGIAINVRYQATKDLGEVPLNMVLQSLRAKLGMLDLTLKAERSRPARVASDPHNGSEKPKHP
jgi:uncharacterized hydrophobic protein (TIGR00271 family)